MSDLHKTPLWDKEEVWSSIEKSLDEKEDRRNVLWWFLIGFGLLVSVVLWMYQSTENQHKNTEIALSDKRTDVPNVKVTKRSLHQNKDEVSNSPTNKITLPKKATFTRQSTRSKSVDNQELAYTLNENITKNVQTDGSVTPSNTKVFAINKPTKQDPEQLTVTSLLPKKHSHIAYRRYLDFDPQKIAKEAAVVSRRFELYASYDIGRLYRSMSGNEKYSNTKKQHENPAESQMFKLLFRRHFGSVSIGGGVCIERNTTIVDFQNKTFLRSYTIASDSTYVSNQSGSVVYLPGEKTVYEYRIQTVHNPNRHYSLSIPLEIRYTIQRIKTDVAFTYYWNVWNSHMGYYLNDQLQYTDKNDTKAIQKILPNKSNRIGVGIGTTVFSINEVDIRLNGQYIFDTKSKNTYINEKYSNLYLGLGARYTW